MTRRLALLAALSILGCKNESAQAVAGPSPTRAAADAWSANAVPAAAPPAAAGATPTATADAAPTSRTEATPAPRSDPAPTVDPSSPIQAHFVDLAPTAGAREEVKFRACEQYFVGVARGTAKALGEELGAGDVLVAQGAGAFDVTGRGLAVIASVRPYVCEPHQATSITRTVVRATAAPELTWAGGKMHAHLDVESALSPLAYWGRLSGTAPVAEHAHDASWEVVCAIDAAGTFTLAGTERRLGPRQIVAVPPGTKHAWRPDDGSKLVAFQIYSPPGPEQRFRQLAADAAHPK